MFAWRLIFVVCSFVYGPLWFDYAMATVESTEISDHSVNSTADCMKNLTKDLLCDSPQLRVMDIPYGYFKETEVVTPSTMLLFRCVNDSGCCFNSDSICKVKKYSSARVDFRAEDKITREKRVLTLFFPNHMECHCVNKSALNGTRDSSCLMDDILNDGCKCPQGFIGKRNSDDLCECHCPDNSKSCNRIINGFDFFSIFDKECISKGNCIPPRCNHGRYRVSEGRCLTLREFMRNAERTANKLNQDTTK